MDVGFVNTKCGVACAAQEAALASVGCAKIVTGGRRALFEAVAEGDKVVAASISCLGKTPLSVAAMAEDIDAHGCALFLVEEGIDTTEPAHAAFFSHISVLASASSSKRPKAKAHTGGKPKADPSALARAIGLYDKGDMSVAEICAECKIGKSTLYRALKEKSGEP